MKRNILLLSFVLTIAICATMAGCSLFEPQGVFIVPDTPYIQKNESVVLTAYNEVTNKIYTTANWILATPWLGSLKEIGPGKVEFTSTAYGSARIVASVSNESLSDEETIEIYEPELDRMTVEPSSVDLIEGATKEFTAKGFDQYNRPFSINPSWSVQGNLYEDGSFNPTQGETTIFTAGRPDTDKDTGRVRALHGFNFAESSVSISRSPKVLDRIVVTPASAKLKIGEKVTFTATGYDQYGGVFALPSAPVWSLTKNLGIITPDGNKAIFEATADGLCEIVANSGKEGKASIEVNLLPPVLSSIAISPSAYSVEWGSEISVKVIGYDQYDREMAVSTLPRWSVAPDLGWFEKYSSVETKFIPDVLDGSGNPIIGACTITATCTTTSGTLTDTQKITIKEHAQKITSIRVDPGSADLYIADKADFSAVVLDQYRVKMRVMPPISWTVVNSIGTIVQPTNTTASFTATNAGDGLLRVTASPASVDVPIHVKVKRIPKTVTLSPSSWVLDSPTKTFYASVTDQYGVDITSECSFVWEMTGTGSYSIFENAFEYIATRSNTSASIKVYAKNDFGEATATAAITVPSSYLKSATLSPTSFTMIGTDLAMAVTEAKDQYGFTIPLLNCSYSWSISSGLDDIGNLLNVTDNPHVKMYRVGTGFVNSTTSGTVGVRVTYNSKYKDLSCSISVPYCYVSQISVSGASSSVDIDSKVNYSATCKCQYNHSHSASVNWKVEGGINGEFSSTYSSSTTFTARRAGTGSIVGYTSKASDYETLKVNEISDYKSEALDPLYPGIKINPENPLDRQVYIGDLSDLLRRDIPEGAVITGVEIYLNLSYSEMSCIKVWAGLEGETATKLIWNYQEGDDYALEDYYTYTTIWNNKSARNRTFHMYATAVEHPYNWLAAGLFKYMKFTVHWKKSVHPGF